MKAEWPPPRRHPGQKFDRSRWRPCSPLWWYGIAVSRCRRHHYNEHGCALGVCMPGRARADCTRGGITSHGVVRGWKYRAHHGTHRCCYLPEPVERCAVTPGTY